MGFIKNASLMQIHEVFCGKVSNIPKCDLAKSESTVL